MAAGTTGATGRAAARVIPPAAVSPDDARRTARDILSGHEYRPESSPQPLRGALEWLGDRLDDLLAPVGRFFERIFGWLFDLVPGPAGTFLGAAILLGVATLIVWLIARRIVTTAPDHRHPHGAAEDSEDPADLERAARDAAAAGDHRLAIRLRYRAGLLRLGARGAIALRTGATNAVYARALHSERFDGLTGTFEAVTYGDREAAPEDDATAVREWPLVVEEAAPR